MRIGSLFSGIGGLELGLERAGVGHTVWQVEKEEYCRQVLARHWPDAVRYEDVTTVDWAQVEPVEVLCGGFPCQPFSVAGRQQGTSDERWMWPAFADAVRVLRPRYVVVENVPALLRDADAWAWVLSDLAALGFDAEWDCVPAAAVGARHLRDRVYLLACAQRLELRIEPVPEPWRIRATEPRHDGPAGPVADSAGQRSPHRDAGTVPGVDVDSQRRRSALLANPEGQRFRTPRADSVEAGTDALAGYASQPRGDRAGWEVEPDVGRVADGVPARVDRLRALGNAVVPQVAEVVGRRLMELAA